VAAADLEMRRQDELAYQAQYFDMAKNQYPRGAIVIPPKHTAVECQAVLDRLRDVPADGVVIDFGAGTGRLSISLARAGYSVLAVDVSERSLAVLEETARDLGLHAVDTASTLPGRGSFSAIVGSDVLHHVDLDVQLPRIYGLLREGGKVAFTNYVSRDESSRAISSISAARSNGMGSATCRSRGSDCCRAPCSAGPVARAGGMTPWATGPSYGGSRIAT
jgi:2-polyprenyl-3-methyl-5-hydroxy-6-metoxy-1,4-benzoquinol methylase